MTTSELAAPLRDALRLGLHHAPLAEAALDALEAWLARRGRVDDGGETDAALPSVVAALRPYVDRAPQEDGRELEADAASGVDPVAAGATGAGYREAKRAAKRGRAADLEASREGLDARDGGLDARVARLIGAMGGAAHALVGGARGGGGRAGVANAGKTTTAVAASDGGSCLNDASVWDPDRRVGVEVSVGGGPGGGAAKLTVSLDAALPRAASLALTSSDRATKVAAAEFLHAATLLMVGRNARRPAPKGGDYAREPTPFHRTYRRLFPVILELAVDPEPVTKQLFSSLAYQLARWFTRNQAREAAETVALLDAITEGLAGGDEPGSGAADGAAARRRELCASLAAECLEWSVRHLPSGGGGGDQGGAAVNVKSILRRLFALMTHPEPSKRLGASVALRRSLVALRNFPAQCEAHALEILEAALRGLRSVENDPPRAGAEEAGALLARAAVRACARHAGALGRRPAAGALERGGAFGTLQGLVAWLFADGVARAESRARLESQFAFAALVQRLPGYTTPAAWFDERRRAAEKENADRASWWPFRVVAPASNERARAFFAPPRAADGSPVDRTGVLLAGASWLKSLVAALHWARWALERRVVRAEDLAPRPGEEDDPAHPLAAAAAFLREGGAPALDELPLRDDEDAARKQSSGASSRAVREWRRARVKASVQILVLAQHVASDAKTIEGAASFLGALERGGDGAGLARLACAAVLAPETLGADTAGGRMDDVNQLAGAAARLLQPVMGDPGAPASGAGMSGAPAEALRGVPAARAIRVAARDGARAALRRGGRFDLGAADLRSARGLGAARRLAAGYRALANVNLLRALLPAEGPRVAVAPGAPAPPRRARARAGRLPRADGGGEGARHRRRAPRRPPRFHLRRRPGRRGRRGRRRGSAAPRGCRPLEPERVVVSRRLFRREPPSRRKRPALGEGGGAGGGRRGGVPAALLQGRRRGVSVELREVRAGARAPRRRGRPGLRRGDSAPVRGVGPAAERVGVVRGVVQGAGNPRRVRAPRAVARVARQGGRRPG